MQGDEVHACTPPGRRSRTTQVMGEEPQHGELLGPGLMALDAPGHCSPTALTHYYTTVPYPTPHHFNPPYHNQAHPALPESSRLLKVVSVLGSIHLF